MDATPAVASLDPPARDVEERWAAEASPYRGPFAYGELDGGMFFGREADAERIVARILSGRITLLHAPSGAGKTSLIRARALPGLTRRGVLPAVLRPGSMSDEDLRDELWAWLVPDPAREAAHLTVVRSWIGIGEDESLEALPRTLLENRSRYQQLAALHGRLAPGPLSSTFRFAVGDFPLAALLDHLSPYLGHPRDAESFDLSCEALLRELESEHAGRRYAELTDAYRNEASDLASGIATHLKVWGERVPHVDVAIFLDQFEEMFTLGRGIEVVSSCPGWPAASDDSPVRYVVSMRDDYVGRALAELPLEGTGISRIFRLDLLEASQAHDVVREPFKAFGVEVAKDAARHVVETLTSAGRFVPPAALSIVCERLWAKIKPSLAQGAGIRIEGPERFYELLGIDPDQDVVTTILREHIEELVGKFRGDDGVMYDRSALDTAVLMSLLSSLITRERTRRVTTEDELRRIAVPRREIERLLEDCYHARVATSYARGEEEGKAGRHTTFVEVAHEFLIGPILSTVEKLSRSGHYRPWCDAVDVLRGLQLRRDQAPEEADLRAIEYEYLMPVFEDLYGTAELYAAMASAAIRFGTPRDIETVVDLFPTVAPEAHLGESLPIRTDRGLLRKAWEDAQGDFRALLDTVRPEAVLEAAIKWGDPTDDRAIAAAVEAIKREEAERE